MVRVRVWVNSLGEGSGEGERGEGSTILEKFEPMTVMGSAIVMMPAIITTTVMSLPSGVTWMESRLGVG